MYTNDELMRLLRGSAQDDDDLQARGSFTFCME